MIRTLFALCLWVVCITPVAAAGEMTDAEKNIHAVLDDFHDAADKGDKSRYLNHFADNAVFLGTDDWERWPLPEFADYVNTRFKDGKGWSYKPVQRHVAFSEDGRTAWFDEITVSEKWGRFRGTGVLLKDGKDWKIAHYALAILVPNDSMEDIATLAKEGYARQE
ncbi:nuclear transport factor 2 family protein [Luteithermobacter gelatinilyticus]|uniref:nuclear transport factor 2 family protein n=1 Tax=Luteithermobacter gelatinilyticus TaxID=2582913 RepID=UPI0011062C92|nr:nuclear transport factor 2 family protein [Luteithermobacter gelatinilyticus]|tara:strand:- start:3660 stop:4154 length:495 start_codon:yes stop_codon:yes gene_type:complete